MLLFWVVFYLVVTLLIGIYSSTLIKSSKDFLLAGRRLPLPIAISTVFATWFGSETILGSSVEFAKNGLQGVIEEPFGAALGLIIVGLFFARPLYRKNYLTLGDFFKDQFGPNAEMFAAIFLVVNYLGWIAAQMVAMGLVLSMVVGINIETGIIVTSIIVIIYSWIGGLWAVSLTDTVQMVLIIIGLVAATIHTMPSEGVNSVIVNLPEDYFQFLPKNNLHSYLIWLGALLTLGLGSVPQQDVFQRIMASKSENVAVISSIVAGLLYLSIALIPLWLGLIAKGNISNLEDPQMLLPNLILNKTPLAIQVLFFGALLSAIMSTASGAIIAPSALLSENIIKPLYGYNLSDKQFLQINRYSIIIISLVSLGIALVERNIYDLVAQASALDLVTLFIPMVAGLFFKNRSEKAVLGSMILGMGSWIGAMYIGTDIPEIFVGLLGSLIGFALGKMLQK